MFMVGGESPLDAVGINVFENISATDVGSAISAKTEVNAVAPSKAVSRDIPALSFGPAARVANTTSANSVKHGGNNAFGVVVSFWQHVIML